MIATVCLNPAIDKTMTALSLTPGQVNRMTDMRMYAGGKGVNVTKILREFEVPVVSLGFVGGPTGTFIEEDLAKRGVDCRFTKVQGTTRTTLNILSEDGYVTEILEPGDLVQEEEQAAFLESYKEVLSLVDTVVLSGSLPVGMSQDFYCELIRMGKEQGKRMILDTSKEALSLGVTAGPFLVKPNLKELEYIAGRPLKDLKEQAIAVCALQDKGVEHVILSRGKRGLMTVLRDENGDPSEVFTVSVPDVNVVNTVGSGDCVVASLSMSLDHMGQAPSLKEWEEALLLAAALSSANVTTMESGNVPLDVYETMKGQVKAERIQVKDL